MDEPTAPGVHLKRGGFGWEAITVALSTFFQKSTYFFTSLILARTLGVEGRGLVSALQIPAQLAVSLSELGIRQSAAYHIGRGNLSIERATPTLLAMVPLASMLGIGVSLVYFAYSGVAENDWVLQTLAVLTIPFSLIASYASGVFLGRQRIAAFRKTSWRPALLRLVLIVLLCWVVSLGAYGALMAGLAASALGAGYALWLLAKETPLRIRLDREAAVMLQRRGFAFAVSLFALTVNYKIMVLLLTAFGSLTDVGLYVQATVIAELIWEVPTIIGSLVLSRGVNAKDQDLFSHKVLVLARISLLAAAAAAIVIAVISPYAFPLLFGPEFAGSATLCNILLPGVAAFIVFKTLNMDLAARGKPWVASLVVGPALLINIGLGWWMIERYGATGAAITSTLCFVGASIAYVIAYSRVTGIGLRPMLCYRRSDFEIVLRQLPIGRRAA